LITKQRLHFGHDVIRNLKTGEIAIEVETDELVDELPNDFKSRRNLHEKVDIKKLKNGNKI